MEKFENVDVSVIITTYNRLHYLPRAIDSCKNTFCKTEIIVIDDGSTDGTWDWLQQQDVISFKQNNQGQTYAINKGVAEARGKYIRFLDSDDFLEDGIIDQQFQCAETTGAELIYSRIDNYYEKEKSIVRAPEINQWEDFMEVQLSSRYGSLSFGMLFKSEYVKLIPRRPDFALREDRMFLLEYALLNPTVKFVEGCAGYWVKHESQMQGNYEGMRSNVANWQHVNIFKKILSKLEEKGELTVARKKAATTVLWPLSTWIAKKYPHEALAVYKWIKELDTDFVPFEKGILLKTYQTFGFKWTQRILRLRRILLNR